MLDEKVPQASRVAFAVEASYRFHATIVQMALANDAVPAERLVAEPCAELAAAAFQVNRDCTGAAKADCEVGVAVANSIQRFPGRVTAAAPVIQSSSALARYGCSATAYRPFSGKGDVEGACSKYQNISWNKRARGQQCTFQQHA